MRRIIGILMVLAGLAMLFGAWRLNQTNTREAASAELAVTDVLPQLKEEIPEMPTPQAVAQSMIPLEHLEPEDLTMTEKVIDGCSYIGWLSLPRIRKDLPILADWDYDLLKKAPCRFTGTLRGNDLVLMAHNYKVHFGPISRLKAGDEVIFTDMDGVTTRYRVVGRDILAPSAVEEMTAGDFDLTLFTCTYGGENRVTVYCDKE